MIEELKEALMLQGKEFLEQFGEFFPFATAIDFEGRIVPIGIYFGEDHPSVEDVLKELEMALKKRKEENIYKLVGICTDVIVMPPGQQIKVGAIEMRIDGVGIERINIYVPYMKKGSKIEFTKPYSEIGNLIIW